METAKRLNCPEHPEFEPNDEDMYLQGLIYQCCPTCTGHYYATQPAGRFDDEIPIYPGISEAAEIRIGSSNAAQFGLMRQVLLWYLEDWRKAKIFVDPENQTIYLIGLKKEESDIIITDCLALEISQ